MQRTDMCETDVEWLRQHWLERRRIAACFVIDEAIEAERRFLRGLARRGAPNPRLVSTCDGRGWLFYACAQIALKDPVRARRIALAMTTGLENAMRWCWEHERGMRGGGCFDELAGLHCRWMWMLNTGIWLGERGQPLVGEDEGAAIWRVTR
jgi:hypothetical protein